MTERVWGVWEPVPGEALPIGQQWARPLEWWPSQSAVEKSLRQRVPREIGVLNTDVERRADGRTIADAQYYGGRGSAVFLYRVQGEPGADPRPAEHPHAVVEFGPRGGVRRRVLANRKG